MLVTIMARGGLYLAFVYIFQGFNFWSIKLVNGRRCAIKLTTEGYQRDSLVCWGYWSEDEAIIQYSGNIVGHHRRLGDAKR